MKYLLHLSGEHLELAAAEAVSVLKPSSWNRDGAFLVFESSRKSYSRLAYTKAVYRLLFTGESMRGIDRYVRGTYCVRTIGLPLIETADKVYRALRHPRVDVVNPDLMIVILKGSREYVCTLLWENTEDFEGRKAHKQPGSHPVGSHPKLCRAMVNLLGVPMNSVILDPFCGTGGILIEAGLMGYRVRGFDIDSRLVSKAQLNLKKYGFGVVFQGNALDVRLVSYVVADLPYGRNTRSQDVVTLYKTFLGRKGLKRMVLGFSDAVDVIKLCRWSGWKIESRFLYYIHRSLSKQIVVLTK